MLFILNSMAIFNHSNIKLNTKLDEVLKKLFVTPAMHCIHHSCLREETDSNYGFNLSIWDYVFTTYKKNYIGDLVIGQNHFNKEADQNIWSLLIQPFKKN